MECLVCSFSPVFKGSLLLCKNRNHLKTFSIACVSVFKDEVSNLWPRFFVVKALGKIDANLHENCP